MNRCSKTKKDIQLRYIQALQSAGLKASSARVRILAKLEGMPRTLSELKQQLGTTVHQATLYRSLPELVARGVITEIDFPGPETRYEFSQHHHHHIVCRACGTVEGINVCISSRTIQKALAEAKQFKKIQHHSLEFLGICGACSP